LWRSFHYFDSDSSGAIEAGEFGNHFNEDGSGRLSREQLALALTSFGAEPLSEAELETIFQMGDRDGSGDLSIDGN
uniref:EF-hand domain-containing protein n=1 Tax=Macrostomum lignano TaxID=282301 RepID=A0A1I8IKZ4_9PLAT